jgi:hypothetical protein
VYDGNPHGATGTCSGVGTLVLGASFTNVPGGTANWTFTGNGNYNDDSGSVAIDISKADATIVVNGFSGVYDATAHGATGSATGVKGESLSGLDLGASFTNVPGGTANWTFTDSTGNYNDDAGSVAIDISKADATIAVNGFSGVYDATAHGATGTATGVGGANLNAGLNLGASFTNVPGGTAHWTFAGGTNYNDASGDVTITITKADATCLISGYSGLFDGAFHGASGSCSGIGGETAGTLDLGATYKYPTGGTANWTFTGNGNYNDQAGSVAISISAWTYTGFYQPVDMGNVWNTVKGGSTVPLKFNVYAAGLERTDVGAVESYNSKEVACTSLPGSVEDAVETLSATGGTSLRYDTTGHQFIFNWQTPKTTGKCYQVTVTLLDHSKLTAFFKTK